MQSWAEILADVQANWLIYASMPFVAALIGYVTKLVAIRMMFEPIEFLGIKPYLGWQGIVPRKAAIMASIACDTMTQRLLKPQDIFGRLDPDQIAREIEGPLLEQVEKITHEVASHYSPGLWEAAPDSVRQAIIRRIQAEAPNIVRQMMVDLKNNIDDMFDLTDMVVRALMRDKRLLNRIFQEAGHEEFRFIARSGIYFGFVIGCVQAVTWALTHSPWVMPLFGGFTGWFTDWLALKMIFYPKKPTKYLGLFTWQGLFLKRRKEVAAEYGALIAAEVVTPRNVLEAVLRGPFSDRLFHMVTKQVQRSIDEQAGIVRRVVMFAVGSRQYRDMKQMIADKIVETLPDTLRHMEGYVGTAMDLRSTLTVKMQELTEDEFEALLRPAFQQDEWILITVGAVLGFLVGEMQVQVMLHLGSIPAH
ncbi:DUF445 domain-containing protein [Solimonas fluminis]|uniref:DUF445 domain-containing protein n=1 Tax=Solimonas fluminis TaxID=2086571 RepID=A0A2S5TD53_9GAMM|nr:DUF445 domain-containing protein [Solimonas fluminis]PPE72929.1 DUF445 domain-containing protein [Solimonas fluminis]